MSDHISRDEWIAFITSIDPNTDLDDLLTHQEKADDFFDNFSKNLEKEIADSLEINLEPGYRIGKYALIEQIGKGGMAYVYLAKRADNLFEQQVAIKLLPPHNLTESHIAHFNKERELLANLNHPNIGKIFDGGITPDGIPYIVMEYIEGTPIDQYCSSKHLSIDQKIALIIKILGALQHVHNRFILHRDLKPANILITFEGDPKIVDFGIGQNIETEYSASESGTLRYMPPEVINQKRATTQSDLYQVGLILFEILNGTSPFISTNKDDLQKEKVNWQFNKPNVKISRRLNDILQKSLEIQVEKRYLSASEFAQDLINYQTLHPTQASEADFLEQTILYIRRNKVAVSLTVIILAVSLSSAITNQLQIQRTQKEKAKVEEANKFLKSIFLANNPNQTQLADLTARDLLNNSKLEIDKLEDSEVKAYALTQLGEIYSEIGLWKETKPIYEKALFIYLNSSESKDIDIANGYSNMAGYYRNVSQYEQADSAIDLCIELLKQSNDNPVALAFAYHTKGNIKYSLGQYEEGKDITKKSINLLEETISKGIAANQNYTEAPEAVLAMAYNYHSSNLRELSEYNEALEYAKKALEIGLEYQNSNIDILFIAQNNIALAYERLGLYQKQIEILSQQLTRKLEVYEAHNPSLMVTMTNLGSAYYKIENYKMSDSLSEIAYQTYLEKYGPTNQYTVSTLYNLGNSKLSQDKYKEANSYFEKVLDADMETLGNNHPYVAGDYVSLGNVQFYLQNWKEAEEYYQNAYAIYSKNFGEEHQKISYSNWLLGRLYWEMNQLQKSELHYQQAIEISKKVLGEDHILHKNYLAEYDSLFTQINQ